MFKNNHTSLTRLIACALVFLSAPFFPALAAQENVGAPASATVSKGHPGVFKFKTDDGLYQFTIDTRQSPPDQDAWAREQLVPVIKEWYPKIVQFLPSKGFSAPTDVSIICDKNCIRGRAGGGRIIWPTKSKSAALLVHELVHVVQHYEGRNKGNVWLTEGMAEYVRLFLYGSGSKNINSTLGKGASGVHYDDGYIVSANFLHWVAGSYDKDIVPKINDACRQGRYSDKLWKQYTGHTVQELNDEWKAYLALPIEKRPTLKYSDAELRATALQGPANPEKAK